MRTASYDRALAEERPVAFEFNGLAYAVMMATPRDLEDFTVGFALAEGLADRAEDLRSIDVATVENGTVVRAMVPDERAEPLRERLRLRLVEGSCGLCGLESIEEVLRPLPVLTAPPRMDAQALAAAAGALRDHQPLGRASGAMHAAAFCGPDGAIIAAREDVGRHNALDKLIGHLAREAIDPADGFILLSSRSSYELVEKTVRARCPALATVSAATDLAAARAREANLTLVALVRDDGALIMNDPHGVLG
ncbi:formate dehydrogenase accessory sulfurtransferase FdhD [Pacificimonas sp. ICDLI1SI03]